MAVYGYLRVSTPKTIRTANQQHPRFYGVLTYPSADSQIIAYMQKKTSRRANLRDVFVI